MTYQIGGVAAGELAAAYGTPLLVLDYDALDAAIARFVRACEPLGIEVAYAGKALLLVGLAKHLKHTKLALDVCSLGELLTAERAGFPADRITMHGCGKSADELDAVCLHRVGRIVVDNLDELQQLAAMNAQVPVQTLLRLNTAIEAHTHEFVLTSGQGSKFGFDTDTLPRALDVLRGAKHLQFAGLHSHIGSQIYEENAFAANAQALMERAAFCAARGFTTAAIVAGGGFGIAMDPRESTQAIDIGAVAKRIAQTVQSEAQRLNLPAPAIGIEPGRALIGACGTSLYTVKSAKLQFGMPYAIIDGGVFENPRPALYDAYHHTVSASREGSDLVETVVCGRTCENDRLVNAMLPRDLRAGDLLAMQATGAYTFSMASNYNRFERPAVAAVRAGAHSLIARRERTEDLLRNDVDA